MPFTLSRRVLLGATSSLLRRHTVQSSTYNKLNALNWRNSTLNNTLHKYNNHHEFRFKRGYATSRNEKHSNDTNNEKEHKKVPQILNNYLFLMSAGVLSMSAVLLKEEKKEDQPVPSASTEPTEDNEKKDVLAEQTLESPPKEEEGEGGEEFTPETKRRLFKLILIFAPFVLSYPLAMLTEGWWFSEFWWRSFRRSLEKAGPLWIKLGQWAATRPDFFSPSLIKHLSDLHSQVQPHSFEFTQQTIQTDLGKDLDNIFMYFDHNSLASGSVAQVHKAITFDGDVVAVKVLHPNVEKYIDLDFQILKYFVGVIERKISNVEYISLREALEQFKKPMKDQLDLSIEAKNLVRFRDQFDWIPDSPIIFPEPKLEYVSRNVLVESYEPGVPIKEVFTSKNNHYDKKLIAVIGMGAYFQMMINNNFTHSDLHPGNILVQSDGRLVFLDVGIVTELSRDDHMHFLQLVSSILSKNSKQGAELMIKFSKKVESTPLEQEIFKNRIAFILDRVEKIQDVEVGKILLNVLEAARTYKVKIDPNFTTLVVGTANLEGISKQLDPNANFKNALKSLPSPSIFAYSFPQPGELDLENLGVFRAPNEKGLTRGEFFSYLQLLENSKTEEEREKNLLIIQKLTKEKKERLKKLLY